MWYQDGIYPEKNQLDDIKNGDLWLILTSICVLSGKPCQIAKPLLERLLVLVVFSTELVWMISVDLESLDVVFIGILGEILNLMDCSVFN